MSENFSLVEFLEDIKSDFDWELYICEYPTSWDSHARVHFPYCCQLASQLIGSFLMAHGYSDVKCIYGHNNIPPHYWCEYKDLIIDFTDFQFEKIYGTPEKEKLDSYSIEEDEFKKFVSQFPVIYSRDYRDKNAHTHRTAPCITYDEIPLQLTDEARPYAFTKQDFLNYVRAEAPNLQAKLEYHLN